jgi:hypothetical protein
MIWDRGKRPDYRVQFDPDDLIRGEPLSRLFEDNPYSCYFKIPDKLTLKTVVGYMLGEQKRRFGRTVLDDVPKLNWGALSRHAKTLVDFYGIETVYRAVAVALRESSYPFSFKLVGEICQRISSISNE